MGSHPAKQPANSPSKDGGPDSKSSVKPSQSGSEQSKSEADAAASGADPADPTDPVSDGQADQADHAVDPHLNPVIAPGLMRDLAQHLSEALLPGDAPFEGDELKDATQFVLDAAALRKAGAPVIVVDSASHDRRFLRIITINDNMPFLVDSVAATLARHGLGIDRLVHPVLWCERGEDGVLEAIAEGENKGVLRESFIYLESSRIDSKQRRSLESALRETLGDVYAAVQDWPKMQAVMQKDIDRIGAFSHGEPNEGAALLGWLNNGMLTQLGHMVRKREGKQGERLGICGKSARHVLSDAGFRAAFDWFDDPDKRAERVPLMIKANRASNVHRNVPLDLFLIPMIEDDAVVALSVHAGVWTSAALAAGPTEVPILRARLAGLMDKFGFDAKGHAGKALVHALTALPHDLIIGFPDEDIERVATAMMGLVDRPRARLSIVRAPLDRHVFAFVWLPRDLLSTQVRREIQNLLTQGADAQLIDWSLEVEGGNLAMLRFVLDIRDAKITPDEHAMERQLRAMLRGWGEAVEQELAHFEEEGRAAALASRFAEFFPINYRSQYGAEEGARDILRLRNLIQKGVEETRSAKKSAKKEALKAAEQVADQGDEEGDAEGNDAGDDGGQTSIQESHLRAPLRDCRLFQLDDDGPGALRLKIYEEWGALPLSNAVPALENFGFVVLNEMPTKLQDGHLGTIHDFSLRLPKSADAEAILARRDAIEQAITAVLNQEAEDDPFNRLVVETDLDARQADWLRAIYRYLRQTGMGFTIQTVVGALRRAPQVTAALITRFCAAHDPAFDGKRDAAIAKADAGIKNGLSAVQAINDDRLLRSYHAVIKAILRCNVFASAAAEALAFKIDSSLVPGLPKPVPWREIYVYSRRVEGIHLRAGAVARGGLRWSDRRDDYRTEILGLMKAQRVKNAVIVPTGAKGGFYPKRLPSPQHDREGWAAEGLASYQIFIRSLLSITDNIVKEKVVHPKGVVRLDGDDPYFVVAADKGTASFSDIANAIAHERGFWLDDAFASGGSQGYDHKAMGITARGAWVSVQRHFLEMGVDVQTDPVRVIGCGDMSGDVFGNGMLLSRSIRLMAAFDHRHIFIDPDPDAAKGWKERKRLFDLPRSSWEDYDSALISKGGGVYSRSEKSIKISAAACAALGLEQKEWEPDALISAILAAPVDLLWFGGIGTYIKGAGENNAVVGDPANDTLRIDAEDLRVKVVGEGANLGVTQAGRIEFALAGGRINTDFIDNAAGVDCSDNEVNIKIALSQARRVDALSEEERNNLLVDMTASVSDLVLENNRLQALALSVAEADGLRALPSQVHLMQLLEEGGNLDRQTEGLADDQTLGRRAAESLGGEGGVGLVRPELAVLLSSAKLVLQDAIEHSDLPDDAALHSTLIESFPPKMQARFAGEISEHRLRREIIATKLAGRIINRLGVLHPFVLAEEEGADLAQVAAAFVAVENLFELPPLWRALEEAEMPEMARLKLFERTSVAVRNLMSDALRTYAGTIAPTTMIKTLGAATRQLAEASDQLIADETRAQSAVLQSELVEGGADRKMAARVVHLFDLDGSLGVADLAQRIGADCQELTASFSRFGEELGLAWAQGIAARMEPSDVWERLLVAGLARDFQQMRLSFLQRMSEESGGAGRGGAGRGSAKNGSAKSDGAKSGGDWSAAAAALEQWKARNKAAIDQFHSLIARARLQPKVAPAMLAQIASQARNLLGR